jgi:hypothetical protein
MSDRKGDILFEDAFDGGPDPGWRVRPVSVIHDRVHGKALRLRAGDPNAGLWLGWGGDDTWRNYRVEVEVLPQGRGFVGLDFHARDDQSGCCNLHFPASPGERRAFEGCARWNDANTSWKLGPWSQRTVPAREGEWLRLRLDAGETVANLFVDDDPDPVFTVYDLPFDRGGIRLWRYHASALFRNLRVTALDDVEPVLEDVWGSVIAPGVIRNWKITRMLPADFGAETPLEAVVKETRWRDARVDRRGVVDVIGTVPSEYHRKGVVFARATLDPSTHDGSRIRLTYTDQLSMWCDGEPVFSGERRGWNDPGRSEADGWGRLMPDQFEVKLPAGRAPNDIIVRLEVAEPLFGSGFWARLV